MKKIIFCTCLITLLICCSEKKKGSKNSDSITKKENASAVAEIDSVNYSGINSFEEFYNKIPDVKLSSNLHKIVFSTKSTEYQSEMNSIEYALDLGQPEGKILRKDLVVVIYASLTSGYSLRIQTYTKKGEKISNKSLMGIEGISSLDEPNIRYEDSKLYMDKDLNIYNYYKDGYIKANTKDTVIKIFKKEYYKIDELGKILEVKK